MKSQVYIGNEKLKKAYLELKNSKTEDIQIYKWISKAIDDLAQDAFCGTQIRKKLIPKEYAKKFGKLNNLWKYDLPEGWRLIYTIRRSEIVVVAVILEWMDHKTYDKRFRY